MKELVDSLTASELVSFPDPPPKRKGGSGKYSTASHHGLTIAMDSAKSEAFEVAYWASAYWRCRSVKYDE